jgi:hypothetical protein
MRTRFLAAGALALTAVMTAATAGPAWATPAFSLRVEAPGATLDPGTFYSPPKSVAAPRGETSSGGTCVRGGGSLPLSGRSAMGLVAAASNTSQALRPLWAVQDSFGNRICRIGSFSETDVPFSGWLYRVNHSAPTAAADLLEVQKSDEVLWVFANFGNGVNTGDELVLSAPARARPGTIQVGVTAHQFDGVAKPAPDGTVVTGGAAPVTTVGGVATLTVGPGNTTLRAVGPGTVPTEIPSAPLALCVAADLAQCPPQRGKRIVGTNAKESFKGTRGPDVIRARGGADKIKVRGGGVDVVNCGKGKDRVIADKRDRLRRCEKVRGR